MKPSPRIEAFIKGFEQCRLSAYMPTPNDVPTIGYGATGPDIRLGMTWTQSQANARFAADLERFGEGVTKLLAGASTTQGQFDALTSLAFNVGLDIDADTVAEGLGDSTLLRLHKTGDFKGAADEFQKWSKQKRVLLKGLLRRRLAEAAIYRGEL